MTPALARRKSEWARPVAGAAIFLLILLCVWLVGSDHDIYVADTVLLAGLSAIAINLLIGNAGQVSIGTAAFLGIGAYVAVFTSAQLPFLVVVALGGLVSAVFGLLVGLPSLRLRGMYLVFGSLALQYIAGFAMLSYDLKTNALAGHPIPVASIGPVQFEDYRAWFLFLGMAVSLVATSMWLALRGKPGRAWAQVRVNEVAAAAIGINVTRAKLGAFVTNAVLTGVAGAILAYFTSNVAAEFFTLDLAISYVAMILIGGLRSIPGSLIGAFVITALPYATQSAGAAIEHTFQVGMTGVIVRNIFSIDAVVYGLIVLAVVFFEPTGAVGLAKRAEVAARRLWLRVWSRGLSGRGGALTGPQGLT
jgi:branched-chain amino acid transport system permease protein